MSRKLKIGDKVICIDASMTSVLFEPDKVYTISYISSLSTVVTLVEFGGFLFMADRFLPVYIAERKQKLKKLNEQKY